MAPRFKSRDNDAEQSRIAAAQSILVGGESRYRLRRPELSAVNRQLPQALSSRIEYRVDNCGRDAGRGRFAHSSRCLGTVDQMDLDGGCFVDPQHLVGVEVRLGYTTPLERDLA